LLPDPPGAIDHAVVEIEQWVTRGSEDVTAWVSAHGVVTCSRH
jgi:hypothetical protein